MNPMHNITYRIAIMGIAIFLLCGQILAESEIDLELRAIQKQIQEDPHRPHFHFVPPANWMNDPNGLMHWKGQYHLFYQHNPYDAVWSTMHWGHAVSDDLIHWRHLPIALYPDQENSDIEGCWSGCAVIDDGVPTLIYTGIPRKHEEGMIPQVQSLSIPADKDLIHWKKAEDNPVIGEYPEGLTITGFRDPYVWKEGETWFMTLSSGIEGIGGTVLLYESNDLHEWSYLHPIYTGDKDKNGYNWECVNFLPLGDKHLLIASPQPLGRAIYFVGKYEDQKFTPEVEGEIDLGGSLYAPLTFQDEQGRVILIGWLRETRSQDEQVAARWSGAQSLPRVLSLNSDGTLRQEPVEEVKSLREKHISLRNVKVSGLEQPAEIPQGRQMELELKLNPGTAKRAGLHVLRSAVGDEYTAILYDTQEKKLIVENVNSVGESKPNRVYESPLEIDENSPLRLRIFLDGSVIEMFAQDGTAMTTRAYPTSPESIGVSLISDSGEATFEYLDVWTMKSIWRE